MICYDCTMHPAVWKCLTCREDVCELCTVEHSEKHDEAEADRLRQRREERNDSGV